MSSSSSSAAAQSSRTVDIDTLSLDQLQRLKQQEESRIQALTTRLSQLRQAAVRIGAAQRAVADFAIVVTAAASSSASHIMVPLTDSVFVPGRIPQHTSNNKLLVEIGTGYFVERTPKDAISYLERKLKLVDANSDNVDKVIQASLQNVDAIQTALQGKMLEIRARQEGARHRAAIEGTSE